MEIYHNSEIYAFLTSYFADYLSDPYFMREIEQAPDQRLYICEQMAAWLSWEKHYSKNKGRTKMHPASFDISSCLLPMQP